MLAMEKLAARRSAFAEVPRRRPLALRLVALPLWAFLLPLGSVGGPIPANTGENSKQLEISLLPTEETEALQDQKTKEEEESLKDLVGLLQDMVRNIPTEEPSPSVTVDTVWMKLKSRNGGVQTEVSQTASLTNEITTAFWKPRSDASASVILRPDTTAAEETTAETLQSETTASVLYNNGPTSQNPLASVSRLLDDTTTSGKTKTFDQLTNGALSSLVESLKNVKKIQETLSKSAKKMQQETNNENNAGEHLGKPVGANILDLIDVLAETIKNAPSAVKDDPAVHNYIEKAESFLKDALELTGEAEKKLMQAREKEQEKEVELETNPSQSTILTVSEVTIRLTSPSDSLEEKAENTQLEMGKLKAFINLLYGFSPHLSTYAKNSPKKKTAGDIVDRAMAVLDAMKSILCGNPGRRSKQMLKRLSKEDMVRFRQAMKEQKI